MVRPSAFFTTMGVLLYLVSFQMGYGSVASAWEDPEAFPSAQYRTLIAELPAATKDAVLTNLSDTRGNWRALVHALQQVEDNRLEGMAFLIAYMPLADRVSVTSDFLLEHVEYAYRAREHFPWGKDVPKEIFLNDVLPFRASLEPLEPWRKDFYTRLLPVVEECRTASDAAVKVNYWVKEQADYKPDQLRTEGPYEVLKRGFGRCGELSVLYVAACRSVGIPARVTFAPRWSTKDGNHQWVEVWDGQWFFTGAGEPKRSLNKAWFVEEAAETAKVYAKSFRPTPIHTEQIFFNWRDLVDVTEHYGPTGKLVVGVTEHSKPAGEVKVHVSIWNETAWRTIAHVVTDSLGRAETILRGGTYFVTAGIPGRNVWKIAHVRPNATQKITMEVCDGKEEEHVNF